MKKLITLLATATLALSTFAFAEDAATQAAQPMNAEAAATTTDANKMANETTKKASKKHHHNKKTKKHCHCHDHDKKGTHHEQHASNDTAAMDKNGAAESTATGEKTAM